MKTAILGASPKADRYSNKALHMLRDNGHEVFPVHPLHKEIEGEKVYASILDIPEKMHTVTMYLGTNVSDKIGPDILKAAPQRVIFNPGAENPRLAAKLRDAGVEVLAACTLVLLTTGQF